MREQNISLASTKQKVEWLEEVNRELVEACKLALEKLEWAKQKWPQLWPIDLNPKGIAEDHLKKAISKAEGTK